MKKIIFVLTALIWTASVLAQSPQKMSYQAVIRNSSNGLVTSTQIGMQLSILQGSANGKAVYTETQTPTTNANGLVNIEIGGGVGFSTINWANDIYFIKTETDPTGGTNYTITGTSQLLSVPYALHAKTAETITEAVTESDPVFKASQAANITTTDITHLGNLSGINTGDQDGSETKITAGSNTTITGKGTVDNPYIINVAGASLLAPTVSVQTANNIQSFFATLNGTVNANNLSTTVAFESGSTTAYANTAVATQSPVTGTSVIPVSVNLSALQSNTTYHYRIKATNAVNVTYSSDMTFTTAPSAPQLTTSAISSILALSANSGGNVLYDGGAAVTARGICYNTNPTPTIANSIVAGGTGTGFFVSNLSGLSIGTTYYVRAYATNSVGTTYGNEISFTTVALPLVNTSNFSDIIGISAKAGGTVTNNGGSAITAQGLCWSTSSNPTTANNVNTSFTDIMSGLSPNTVYYVRAYASNLAGTGYGTQITFNSGYIIGTTYGGGFVFYNSGTAHGIVCAATNQSTGAEWGCLGTINGNTSTAINTGEANTNAILASCTTVGIASKLCSDLVLNTYSDWYLPSKDELNLMYVNLHTQSLGGFAGAYYWSSSEDTNNNAWCWNFNISYQISNTKSNTYYVRAVRTF